MAEAFNLRQLSDVLRVAYYGAMFAVASVDGEIGRDELAVVLDALDLEGLSDSSRATLRSYLIEPPALDACLQLLATGGPELRYGVMVALVEVVLADHLIMLAERAALERAKEQLQITDAQLSAIEAFCLEAMRVRERGLDDNAAAEALKQAASGLTAVGVPIAAVYFSGSVLGLSAAGITSGLAALGLGLGMVPGIGVAVMIGIAGYYAVDRVFDRGNKRKRATLMAERERRAQRVIQNLQDLINDLVLRLASLQRSAEQAQANAEAIRSLNLRLLALQQLLARRKETALVVE